MLECSLLAIAGEGGAAGKGGPNAGGAGGAGADFPGSGRDPGGKIAGGDSVGPGGAGGGAGKVAATERTKTVLACLFEALGQQRATREVARVFCALSARTAQAMSEAAAAAAAAAAVAAGGGAERVVVAVAVVPPAAEAVAPRALLPVLESMPPQSANGVGLAMEVLETGQAAADALGRVGGGGAGAGGGRVVVFGSVDASGRCVCV